MLLINKLKLYRVKTFVNYLTDSWGNSAFVLMQSPGKKRLPVYFDLVKSFLCYGADFNDYRTGAERGDGLTFPYGRRAKPSLFESVALQSCFTNNRSLQ